MASCGVLPSSPVSDERLAHGVRDGDDHAFEVLYQRYWGPLRRYAGRLLRDASEGEDAAQVAFANAYRALRSGHTPRSVRPWLYAIARNAAWALRGERAGAVELSPELIAREDAPAGEGAALIAALAQLPDRQRVVFALRELRGATNSETAEALGLRESQVEQLLFAGRARLAELLLFGDSVSCESVRALGTGELSRPERRALKRHVHHCPECTSLVGGRLKLGARLLGPVEAFRRLIELGLAASAPAKAGAVTAIAMAVSAPIVIPRVDDKPARQPEQQRVLPAPPLHVESVQVVPAPARATPHPAPKQVARKPSHVGRKRIVRATPGPKTPVRRVVTPAPAPAVTAPVPAPTPAVSRPVTPTAAPPSPRTATTGTAGAERQSPVQEREPAVAPTATTPERVQRAAVATQPAPAATTVETVTSVEPAVDSRSGATEPAGALATSR